MEPMYRPQDDVGSIKTGFTRNYTPNEIATLKDYIASHSGSLGTLVDRLSGAGIPLQDIAALTKSAGTGAGVAGMAASMPKSPNAGVDMGGGYGGMAPTAYGTAPFHGSGSGLAALAGQVERTPRMPDNIDPGERIPRAPQGRYEDLYPPQRPLPPTGGYSGPGGMFPSQGREIDYPTPVVPSFPPSEYMVDPDRIQPVPEPMPPRAPDGGISDEYYHGDPLGTLMGQVADSRIPNERLPIGEAMKRGGAVDISQHPTLVRMALGNRR